AEAGGRPDTASGGGFVSPDGYHRFSPTIPEHGPAVRRLAEIFLGDQEERYLRTLWSALQELPSEVEEQGLRWRGSRLEEHAFPNAEEAISVYAQPAGTRRLPEPMDLGDDEALATPRSPLRLLRGISILIPTLDRVSGELRDRLLHEIVSLANHLLIADLADLGNPAAHLIALERAVSYVEIGLALHGARDETLAAEVVSEIPILELFREGYAPAAALQARAGVIVQRGWASRHPHGLDLLDAPIRQRIKGLLEPLPLFFDPAGGSAGTPYRHFRILEEIEETRVALEIAEVVGRVFSDRLGALLPPGSPDSSGRSPRPLRVSTLFLTAMAWHQTSGEVRYRDLPPAIASEFLRAIFPRDRIDAGAPRRALDALIDRLAQDAPYKPREMAALQRFGLACLHRLEQECGSPDAGSS
ncbi:MAG: DUF6178 family protein, partial [Vicinamibacteria bacterium]